MDSTQRLDRALDWIVGTPDHQEEALQAAREKFTQAAAESVSYAIQWHANSVLEAEEHLRIAVDFQKMLENGLTVHQAADAFLEDAERKLQTAVRGESKSTSQLTNVVEEVQFATRARIYSKLMQARRSIAVQEDEERAVTSDEELAGRLPEYGAEAVSNLFPEDLNRLALNVREALAAAEEKAEAGS